MSEWNWLGHKMHLCVAERCEFSLATVVGDGKYIVSTIGEFRNNSGAIEPIGATRILETYVFKAGPIQSCGCPAIEDFGEIDSEHYMTANEATEGHMAMCRKWDKR